MLGLVSSPPHKALSRITDQHSRNQAFSLAGGTPTQLWAGRGSAMSSGHLGEGQVRGFIPPLLPHTTLPLQHIPWAAPCTQPASLPQCFLPPFLSLHGSRSPSTMTEGTGRCFSIWRLEEAKSSQKQWISQEKTLPTELCLPQLHRKPLCG